MESDEEGIYDVESDASINYNSSDDGIYSEGENTAHGEANDFMDEPTSYKCLTSDQIFNYMMKVVDEVNAILQLPPHITCILLNHFKWDKEKLMERYYEGDQDKIFEEAQTINPFRLKGKTKRPLTTQEVCDICYLPSQHMNGLQCGHFFCIDCWNEYLRIKIIDEGQGQKIACPANDCNILTDYETILSLLRGSDIKTKYHQRLTDGFVMSHHLMKWCPSPGCSVVVKVSTAGTRNVTCICGHAFCFHCLQPIHEPVRCPLLKKWLRKCNDDSETAHWISANTKECPKCRATIEKNGGCNHMICQNKSCKFDFCWICLSAWSPHGSSWYNCNRYDANDSVAARTAQEKSRAALNRYLFYCDRYMNHRQSLELEHKLYSKIKFKMEEMQQHNMSWIEVQFLKKAVDILCKCRNTLKYTYVFAFYLRSNNQATIFEANQKDLEMATERLSEYLERDVTTDELSNIKQKVQDKAKYCEGRCEALLRHVYEGYDMDLWEYLDE
ncbi:E3 ubiquitin-protein ligase arih1 [Trichoplax sp. H2]|nr:E3 ubiquitin-protein ligase arih1 [Trichoplax sp. H2]|eukprot:RDD37461.1 E3 ubiquitin-protein ligase arih1 [Trichoplax sp. H2]